MATMATRNEADAMDLVQDAMIRLVSRYADQHSDEWRGLFLKILENGILDWHRKETLKRRLFFWRQDEQAQEDAQPGTEQVQCAAGPAEELWRDQIGEHLLTTIEKLPVKQQQCYLLRSWEGLSVSETAEVMGIHQNSVKTHYFRAMEKLREHYAALTQTESTVHIEVNR